jgi:hypothetical protein
MRRTASDPLASGSASPVPLVPARLFPAEGSGSCSASSCDAQSFRLPADQTDRQQILYMPFEQRTVWVDRRGAHHFERIDLQLAEVDERPLPWNTTPGARLTRLELGSSQLLDHEGEQ